MPTIATFDELNVLNAESEPFKKTDKIVNAQVRKLVRLFARLRSRLQLEEDLYLFMTLVYEAYTQAWTIYRDTLEASYVASYSNVLSRKNVSYHNVFSDFVTSYAYPENYVPQNEWQRKRDRAFESIVTAYHNGKPIRAPVETARNAVVKQVKQGADDLTVQGIIDAYADAGVKHWMFHTQEDDRVCGNCSPYDLKVYEFGKGPTLPLHYNCRCFYEPID